MTQRAKVKKLTANLFNNTSFLLVAVNMNSGCLSFIDIYSGGGIKVLHGCNCHLRPKIGKFALQFMYEFLSNS